LIAGPRWVPDTKIYYDRLSVGRSNFAFDFLVERITNQLSFEVRDRQLKDNSGRVKCVQWS
jgi:hypothetical protein